MPKLKFVMFAPEFPPMTGGISEYSYQLAKILNAIGCLQLVLTAKF